VTAPGRAEIFDLGYQPYEGERTSHWARRRAIWRDGVRISLGLGRGAGAKVAPWLLIAIASVPVLILVVIAAFAGSTASNPDDFELPSYAEYYEFAIVPLALFSAVVAPLLICPDRRDGVLSLYAARPITPADYVAARWVAFLTVIGLVACVPEAILFTWNALDAHDTASWLRDNWDLVPRLLLAGMTIAVAFTTLSLLAATFTPRRAYATIATLAVFFVGSAVGGIAENSFTGSVSDGLSLVALPHALVDTARWVFADERSDAPVSGAVSALWVAGLTVVLGLWLLRRTGRLMRG
jgi:ABC-2 type transport system permease protein